MWQSVYSEVDVNLVYHWALILWANNLSPRSIVICFFFWNWVPGFHERNVDETLVQSKQWVSPFYRDSQLLHERNVFRFPENGALAQSKQRVSPFYHVLGLDLVGLIGNFLLVEQLLLLVVEQLLNPILSSNHVSRKSLEEAEATQILSRIWLLQFPSEQLSGYNKLGVFREEWWRSIVSDRTSILSSKQDWCRHTIPCFDVSSMPYACVVQDAVPPSRSCQDPCVLYPYDPQAKKILSVCCSNYVLPISILNWWWNVNWLHIRHNKCTWRNRPEQWHCLVK